MLTRAKLHTVRLNGYCMKARTRTTPLIGYAESLLLRSYGGKLVERELRSEPERCSFPTEPNTVKSGRTAYPNVAQLNPFGIWGEERRQYIYDIYESFRF